MLCPKSGEPLTVEDGIYRSSQSEYPSFNGIVWLYRHPGSALAHWQKKIQDVFDFSLQKQDQCQQALRQPALLPSTISRLKRLSEGYAKFLQRTKKILGLIAEPNTTQEDLSLERVPRQQAALAYQSTLFRDWVWGQEQIKNYADLLLPHLTKQKRIAFLGAGACGLPLMIHNQLKPELSLAVDINPFLLIPAKRLLDGESFAMVEFPQVPKTSKDVYVEHQLQLKGKTAPGFEMAFCDAQNLNLRQGQLDTVVTSWFIDIIPRDFRETAKLINSLLPMDGVWVNIGQLGFDKLNLAQVYRPDEVQEILKEAGFEITHWKTADIPYLISPHDAVGRMDMVWTFSAQKKSQSKRPAHFEYMPNWLQNMDTPVPVSNETLAFRTRSEIYNLVISQVDGHKSIRTIAKVLTDEFGIPEQEAISSVFNFFANFFESQIYREF